MISRDPLSEIDYVAAVGDEAANGLIGYHFDAEDP